MFFHALSEQTFNKAINSYLTKNAESVAEPRDFYDALKFAIGVNFSNIGSQFQSWELQAGYPIVYVTRSYNNDRVRFKQNRFTDDIAFGKVWNE